MTEQTATLTPEAARHDLDFLTRLIDGMQDQRDNQEPGHVLNVESSNGTFVHVKVDDETVRTPRGNEGDLTGPYETAIRAYRQVRHAVAGHAMDVLEGEEQSKAADLYLEDMMALMGLRF